MRREDTCYKIFTHCVEKDKKIVLNILFLNMFVLTIFLIDKSCIVAIEIPISVREAMRSEH